MLRGFDVSHYQGSVDWAALKTRYQIAWGAAKATEGTAYKDSQFSANWNKMKQAGLVRMAYHFAHPGGDPAVVARQFLAYVTAAGGIDAEDIMVMDMESNPANLPMLQVRDWLAGWADAVTAETGRKPFLYTGSGYIANNATKDLKPHYAAWWFPEYPSAYNGKTVWPGSISGYPATNNWGGAPSIWQFSQSFAGSMDASVANMTLDLLKTVGNTTTPTTSTEDDAMLSPEAITQLRAAIQAENEEYGARLWGAPTGTGTKFIAATEGGLADAVAEISAAQTDLDAKLDALTAAVAALTAAVTPKAS